MIIRIFRAWVRPGMHREYEALIRDRAVPIMKQHAGLVTLHVGVPLSTQRSPDEFVIISVWKDLDSLKGFTGENWRVAITLPEEIKLVKESTVSHYETADLGGQIS